MSNSLVSNYKHTSEQIVLDLINHDNNASITLEQVSFGQITPGEGQNVQVMLHSKRGGGFTGSVAVNYNRVLLSQIPYANNGQEHECDLSNVSGLLEFVNTLYGVNVNPHDVMIDGQDLLLGDPPVEQAFDVPQTFSVQAKPDSLVWVGSLSLTITKVRINLAQLWQVQILEGINIDPPFPWPENSSIATDSEGNVRTRPDGSIRTYLI